MTDRAVLVVYRCLEPWCAELTARCPECGVYVETVVDLAEPPDPAELDLAALMFGLSLGPINDPLELRPCGHRVSGARA